MTVVYFILSINSLTTIVQIVIEVSEADTAAAAQIQMNTALSMMLPVGVQRTVAEVDGDADDDDDEEEEGDGQFEGVMSQAEIDSLSKRERKAYFDVVSTLVGQQVKMHTLSSRNSMSAAVHVPRLNQPKPIARNHEGNAMVKQFSSYLKANSISAPSRTLVTRKMATSPHDNLFTTTWLMAGSRTQKISLKQARPQPQPLQSIGICGHGSWSINLKP